MSNHAHMLQSLLHIAHIVFYTKHTIFSNRNVMIMHVSAHLQLLKNTPTFAHLPSNALHVTEGTTKYLIVITFASLALKFFFIIATVQ